MFVARTGDSDWSIAVMRRNIEANSWFLSVTFSHLQEARLPKTGNMNMWGSV